MKIKRKEYTPSEIEVERRLRIHVAVWSYAYEVMDDPLVSDAKFDATARDIDLTISTGNEVLDRWFRKEFSPYTGQWIHSHPDIGGIKKLYDKLKILFPH